MQYLSGPIMVSIFALVSLLVLLKMFPDFGLIDHGHGGVMNYATVAWQHLGRLYPFVLLKIRRDINILVVVLRRSGNRELRNREDHVGLDVPGQSRHFRHARSGTMCAWLGLPPFGSAFHPGVDRRHFLVRQSRVVVELAECGIGMPWRHLPLYDVLANHPRERENLVVRHERHGRDVIGTMASGTVLLQNRRYVSIVGNFRA